MAADGEKNGEMEKTKPTVSHVNIKVRSQDGKETFFKIKRDTQIKKLLKSYCQKFYLDYQATHFYLEGEHFNHAKTPNELELEDNTEIESMADQLGGGDMNFLWNICSV